MSHFTVGVITKIPTKNSVDKALAPFQENNMNDCPKKYLKFYPDEDADFDEEMNQKGYWENPNRKWDWYSIGGRWDGGIPLIDGKYANQSIINKINLGIVQKEYEEAIRFWDVVVEGHELKPGEEKSDFPSFLSGEYYKNQFGDRESYAIDQSSFATFAIVTPEGEWLEKGEMGWFGINSATAESRKEYSSKFNDVVKKYPDYFFTLVDCHI